MPNRQVRLDPDVEELLAPVLGELGDGASWSKAANLVLREVLTPEPAPDGASVPRSGAPRAPRARKPPARLTRRSAKRGAPAGAARARGRCPHPVTRLIGDRCGLCGERV